MGILGLALHPHEDSFFHFVLFSIVCSSPKRAGLFLFESFERTPDEQWGEIQSGKIHGGTSKISIPHVGRGLYA
jgi:hypothetical protein